MLVVDWVEIRVTNHTLQLISAEANEAVFFSLLLLPSAREPKNPGVLPLPPGAQVPNMSLTAHLTKAGS